jgi:hypothetical protein
MDDKQRAELKALAEGLLLVPEEKFDMRLWGLGSLPSDVPVADCDYAGCAIGWASKLIPHCRLVLAPPRFDHNPHLRPSYKGRVGMPAVAKYFGIDTAQASALFEPKSYGKGPVGPKEVAAQILTFLAEPDRDVLKLYTVRLSHEGVFADTVQVRARTAMEAKVQARREYDGRDDRSDELDALVLDVAAMK